MNYIQKLKTFPKKTITRQELHNLFHTETDSELYAVVKSLCEYNLLVPVKSSDTNGNRIYPLYMKYRILFQNEEDTEIVSEIENLHPLLQKNFYLKKHPEKYKRYRSEIRRLDRYLFSQQNVSLQISRKERSFEIFGEEKMLDDKEFMRLLINSGIDKERLAFYDTPEYCFHDYIPVRKDKMTVLILENKDIWFNLRRMMFEFSANVIFDTKIDGVLYGEGNRISGADSLEQYNIFLNCNDVKYLYWGDIDRAGLNIYCSLIKNSNVPDVQLFVPAYEKMLALSENAEIPDSTDKRCITDDYSGIYALFGDKYREMLIHFLESNKRIPQEIISFAWLKENME